MPVRSSSLPDELTRIPRIQRVGGSRILSYGLSSRFITPPKINIEPQNGGLEDDFPFQLDDF